VGKVSCVFSALHRMPTGYEKAVCQTRGLWQNKTEESSAQIFIPYEKSLILVFWEERLVGATASTWNFGSNEPCWSENADFQSIFARRTDILQAKCYFLWKTALCVFSPYLGA